MNRGIVIYYIEDVSRIVHRFELGYISYECAPTRIEENISKLPVISMPYGSSPENWIYHELVKK